MTNPRFALSTGGMYRMARWFGRGLTVASAWPIYYAFFAKLGFDGEELLFGIPALVGGLWLWRWGGYRLRNPRDYLEIDRAAKLARLVRGDAEPTVCELDALGDWVFETWTTTHTSKGSKVTTTWHGVRCRGFGLARLFVADEADACRRWTAEVDAYARDFEPPGWDYSGIEVERVLKTRGLHDRNVLLWTATRFAPAGTQTLGVDALEAAARSLTHTTVAVRIAERLDDSSSVVGGMAQSFVFVGTLLFAGLAAVQLTNDPGQLELNIAILVAMGLALVSLGWRKVKGPVPAAIVAGLAGAAFVGKPWYAPVQRFYDGGFHALSPTSETHLYFVIPGALLLALAVALLTTIEVRKPPPAAATRTDSIDLEPPRPEPPQPPSPG